MELKDAVKFVSVAVNKSPAIPIMGHYLIRAGFIRAYDGLVTMGAPVSIDTEVEFKPHAGRFNAALDRCSNDVRITLLKDKVRLNSGKFQANVSCSNEPAPHGAPEGELFAGDFTHLIEGLGKLQRYINLDAQHRWATGVLWRGGGLFATNTLVVANYWAGVSLPREINIPVQAIKKLISINDVPVEIQVSDTSATFHFSNGAWLKTALINAQWPTDKQLDRLLTGTGEEQPIDPELWKSLQQLQSFADSAQIIYFVDGVARTHLSDTDGASYETGLTGSFAFNGELLQTLKGVATHIDFSRAVKQESGVDGVKGCTWFGDRVRGAIAYIRFRNGD